MTPSALPRLGLFYRIPGREWLQLQALSPSRGHGSSLLLSLSILPCLHYVASVVARGSASEYEIRVKVGVLGERANLHLTLPNVLICIMTQSHFSAPAEAVLWISGSLQVQVISEWDTILSKRPRFTSLSLSSVYVPLNLSEPVSSYGKMRVIISTWKADVRGCKEFSLWERFENNTKSYDDIAHRRGLRM